jgi:hypothetical protein
LNLSSLQASTVQHYLPTWYAMPKRPHHAEPYSGPARRPTRRRTDSESTRGAPPPPTERQILPVLRSINAQLQQFARTESSTRGSTTGPAYTQNPTTSSPNSDIMVISPPMSPTREATVRSQARVAYLRSLSQHWEQNTTKMASAVHKTVRSFPMPRLTPEVSAQIANLSQKFIQDLSGVMRQHLSTTILDEQTRHPTVRTQSKAERRQVRPETTRSMSNPPSAALGAPPSADLSSHPTSPGGAEDRRLDRSLEGDATERSPEGDTLNVTPTADATTNTPEHLYPTRAYRVRRRTFPPNSKPDWCLPPIPGDTKYLVITDSNGQSWPRWNIPDDWFMTIYRGANMADVERLLNHIPRPHLGELKAVFIHVGVNDRKQQDPTRVYASLRRCRDLLLQKGLECWFVNMPKLPTFNKAERKFTDNLNLSARRILGGCFCVPSPTERDITLYRGDRTGLHYAMMTARLYVLNIRDAYGDTSDRSRAT